MRLRKVCPQCGITVHVKRSRCACGHAFALKRKALLTADSQRELQGRICATPTFDVIPAHDMLYEEKVNK